MSLQKAWNRTVAYIVYHIIDFIVKYLDEDAYKANAI